MLRSPGNGPVSPSNEVKKFFFTDPALICKNATAHDIEHDIGKVIGVDQRCIGKLQTTAAKTSLHRFEALLLISSSTSWNRTALSPLSSSNL